MESSEGLISSLIIAGIIFGIGLLCFVLGIYFSRKGKKTQVWPTTEGQIEHSEVIREEDSSNDSASGFLYREKIAYSYKVHSQIYKSEKISVSPSFSSSSSKWADEKVKAYPKNRKVTVYYDPENPAEAVLEQGSQTTHTVLLIIGALLLAAAICLAAFGFLFKQNV